MKQPMRKHNHMLKHQVYSSNLVTLILILAPTCIQDYVLKEGKPPKPPGETLGAEDLNEAAHAFNSPLPMMTLPFWPPDLQVVT